MSFAGQYTDPETGYQYLRARYYDPGTGTFLTRDPLEAQTREPYGYVGGNPLNATDPLGLSECGQFSLGGLIDCAADVSPIDGQDAADFAGGVLNGITLGHAQGLLDGLDFVTPLANSADMVSWDSAGARRGNVLGTALDLPLAVAAPELFGGALLGSAAINGYQCYQNPSAGCVASGAVSAFLGGAAGLGGSLAGSVGGLLFGNLFDLRYDGRFSVELAAAYC